MIEFRHEKVDDEISLNPNSYKNSQERKKMEQFMKNLENKVIIEDLMPWDIYELLYNIKPRDYILLGFHDNTNKKPHDLMITNLFVPPVSIRPTTKLRNDKSNEDDLTSLLSQIIVINNDIKTNMLKGSMISRIIELSMDLQLKVSEYFISELPGYPVSSIAFSKRNGFNNKVPGTVSSKRSKVKTFSNRLKGKFGRFRGNLCGKRVNFSGRTVISPDPNLKIDQIGVPVHMVCYIVSVCFYIYRFYFSIYMCVYI